MAITQTNVNLFLSADSPEGLIELQLINNILNGVHYNYQTPVHDGSDWYVWFFADIKRWQDPRDIPQEDIEMLKGLENV